MTLPFSRRTLIAAATVAALAIAGGVVALTNPFAANAPASAGVSDNEYPISYQTVQRQDLQSQTEVSGTLTYANANNSATSTNIVLPAGTALSTVQQAQQAVVAARQTLAADEAALQSTELSNAGATAQASQSVQAAEAALASDQAALAGTGKSNGTSLAEAEQAVKAAEAALASDQAALAGTGKSNGVSVAQADQSLDAAKETLAADQAALQETEKGNAQALAQAQQSVKAARAVVATDQAAVQSTEQGNAQALAQAGQQLAAAQSTLAADGSTLSSDTATLSADEQKETVDCRADASGSAPDSGSGGSGSGGSGSGGSGSGGNGSTGATSTCSADESKVAQDQAAVTADKQKVTSDKTAVQADEANIVAIRTRNAQALQQAQAQVTTAGTQLATAKAQVPATQLANTKATQQAQAQVSAAQAQVRAARVSLASAQDGNAKGYQQAEAQVVAAEGQVASAKDALAAAAEGNTKGSQQAQAQVEAAQAQVASAKDAAALTAASNLKATQQAQAQVTQAQLAVSEDETDLQADEADMGVSGGGGGGAGGSGGGASPTYTELPNVGQVISRGQELFAINGQPALLLYGDVTPWRAYMPGMAPGSDVGELNANLEALGYGHDLGGDDFTAATGAAIERFQAAHGLPATGELALGSVLFEPAAVEVTTVTPSVGSTATSGQAVLQVTLTTRQVQISLDASQQSDVAVGDKVSIVMPDNSTTPGVVSYVGTVATNPSGGNGPVISVDVTPLDPAATGNLDQLPVNVWITEASVANAWVVPVDALLALAGGGYALEAVGTGGVHHLVGVTLGLFDDADGEVQVSGNGLYNGERIVVPSV